MRSGSNGCEGRKWAGARGGSGRVRGADGKGGSGRVRRGRRGGYISIIQFCNAVLHSIGTLGTRKTYSMALRPHFCSAKPTKYITNKIPHFCMPLRPHFCSAKPAKYLTKYLTFACHFDLTFDQQNQQNTSQNQ